MGKTGQLIASIDGAFHAQMFSAILFALGAALASSGAPAQSDFPTKPVKLVVPVAPGAGADFLARTVADKMSALLGKPIVVENRP